MGAYSSMQHLPELTRFVDASLPDSLAGKRILDLGCGIGWGGILVRLHSGGTEACLVGVDVYQPYIAQARRLGVYNELIEADLSQWFPAFEDYDVVLMLEVIEHLPRDRGAALLDMMCNVKHLHAVVSCPNGNNLRGPVGGVVSEAHISCWYVRDFASRGFIVHGIGIRGLPVDSKIGVLGVYWGTPITRWLPCCAGSLLAVRPTVQQCS
jgi:2-polyprenyl-3-methyl-5-hydroxy-6-metoxy-1,4-benzoquinol methylase